MSVKLQMYLGPYVECADGSADWWDVSEEIDEALHLGDSHENKLVWMPNKSRDGEAERDIDDAGETDLSQVRQWEEIAWFQCAFAVELAVLEKHYGVLTFRWGLVRWWS